MMPLPGRFLTSALVRRDGDLFLFDCGEGTQVSLKMLNLRWKRINAIFISHMHADHVTGLPGLLMLSAQVDRDMPLYIYGPPRLAEYVESSRRILDMYINYEIKVIPVEPGIIMESDEYTVQAFPLDHTKPCFGYSFIEKDRPGVFNVEAAVASGVPRGPLWGQLQRGEDVTLPDGRIVVSRSVIGAKREGRKFSFVTDTRYFPEIADYVHDADFLLCEGMFTRSLAEDAHAKKHMTSSEAAQIALDGHVARMGLQHYSPRYTDRELKFLASEAREIFPETILTRDRMCFDIPNED